MELTRRVFEGVEKPVFFQGVEVGSISQFSDTLLIFALKGVRGEKYKDRSKNEYTGPDGGEITLNVVYGNDE